MLSTMSIEEVDLNVFCVLSVRRLDGFLCKFSTFIHGIDTDEAHITSLERFGSLLNIYNR